MEQKKMLGFEFRAIHNLIKEMVKKTAPVTDRPPLTHLQAGIMCYLSHHREQPVYQKHIEEEFNISGATASNTLQVMERNGLITRSSMDKDARVKRITVTQPALQEHMRVEEHMAMMEKGMVEGMSTMEQAELFRLLAMVRLNLDKMNMEEEEKC